MNNKQAEPLKTGVAELKRLEALPSPQFSDFHKASKEELVDHIIELRLWCGQVVMALKDLQQKIDIVASWQMVHDVSRSEFLEDTVDNPEYNAYLEHINTPKAEEY